MGKKEIGSNDNRERVNGILRDGIRNKSTIWITLV
jgi:hypothetical protein